jgi:hypothetical protein
VYYFGGSLAKIEYKNGFVAKIHEKYLSGEGEKYTLFDLNGLDAVIEQIKDNIKTYYVETGNPEKPAEKKIQGTLITKNQNYIDSEFQYNEDSEIGELRIDLIELSDGELSFVELKGITDNRLRNDENRNSGVPEIIEQMNKYKKFINKYEKELTDYYKKLIQLKNNLGLSTQNENFILNKTPKLLIANTYTKMTKEREERIKAILELLYNHNIKFEILSPYRENERKKTYVWCKKNEIEVDYFVLKNRNDNFFASIADKVTEYFNKNNISFWTCKSIGDIDSKLPTRHTLSSQISCLNHLFPLRYDKQAVLQIVKVICSNFVDVLKIESDEYMPAYIAFEVVSDTDFLNEKCSSRGTMCTSVDALIYAKHNNGKKYILPIEWKYTECYDDKDYSIEDRPHERQGTEGKGRERLQRYSDLITQSKQLATLNDYKNSIYFFEPFYQLMRQTLWAEQIIAHRETETIKADDFIHVHVIPSENVDLLNKTYKCSGKEMEDTWRDCLQNQDKYKIITPQDLLQNIDKEKYSELLEYLETRYWK